MTAEPTAPWTGSRRMLRRLRDGMARPGTPQQRLDQIATLIARELVAEVCSIMIALVVVEPQSVATITFRSCCSAMRNNFV